MGHNSLDTGETRSTDAAIVYVLRRMRAPLITLIVVFAVSVLGLVVIPGADAAGRPIHLNFFQALYVVSYTATTIGFGELPYAFTPGQRMWIVFMIYPNVIAWLYSFGAILNLMQDASFKQALLESAYARHVRRIKEPFHLICGYGDTGQILVRNLSREYRQMVVIDIDQSAINELRIEDLKLFVPGLSADASKSEHLIKAGIKHPYCKSVVAVTDDDPVNLRVAISGKLLNPAVQVICRAESKSIEANMASFGTDRIINPYEIFADTFERFLFSPEHFRLHKRLSDCYTNPRLPQEVGEGHWILCGFGRLGRAMHERFARHGARVTVLEVDPGLPGLPDDFLHTQGTEAESLLQAKVMDAAGVITATNDDANNLSIIMTARALNPNLYLVGRQNVRANDALFEAANIHMHMQTNRIVANHATSFIALPLFSAFLSQAQGMSEAEVGMINACLTEEMGDKSGKMWQLEVNEEEMPAICQALAMGERLAIRHLYTDPWRRQPSASLVPLAIQRAGTLRLMPDPESGLQAGDAVLFFGREPRRNMAARFSEEAIANMLHPERQADSTA